MAFATLLLVLASAFVHAVWNAILKRTRDPEDAVVAVLFSSALSSAAIWAATRAHLPPGASIAWCVASGVLEAFYFVTLARALSRAPLGPVYTTIRGGALLIVWPVSIAFLGEGVTVPTMVGTSLVVLGLAATGFTERPVRDGASLATRLGWAAICALFVGGYQVAYKMALKTGGEPGAVVGLSLGSAAIVNIVALSFFFPARAKRAWIAAKAEPIRIGLAGILTTVGFAMFLVAMQQTGAGRVVTLRNTSILFAQLIAFAMGEKPKRLAVVGALVVTVGAILLAR